MKSQERSTVTIDKEIQGDLKIFAATKRISMSSLVDIAVVEFMNNHILTNPPEFRKIALKKMQFETIETREERRKKLRESAKEWDELIKDNKVEEDEEENS